MRMEELLPNSGIATPQEIQLYQRKIGSVTYAAITTRADIARATQKLAEFLTNPSPEHHAAADHLIDYLHGTRYFALEFGGDIRPMEPRFIAASDAAYGDDPVSRVSTEGYVFELFDSLIDWQSKKQACVSKSTTEAETRALSNVCSWLIWWQRFFDYIKLDLQEELVVLCDNLQTVRIAMKESPKLITKLRHIDIHQSWIREQTAKGTFKVEWIETSKMPADGMTKVLSGQKHENFLQQLHMTNVKELVLALH
jgi:hypothetical protein